ncbi:MAG: hypothetical protein JST00_12790 [Deltaproteobacteria bacterium]|nr:hypothetical protein [Deltaproteobacteria bacterium]
MCLAIDGLAAQLAALTVAALTLLACGAPSAARTASAPPPTAEPNARAVPSAASPVGDVRTPISSERGLDVRVRFDDKGLHVRVAATAPTTELAAWELPTDILSGLEVRSANDEPLVHTARGRDLVIDGARGPTVVVRYDVRPPPARPPGSETEAASTMIEASRFRTLGSAALALPRSFLSKKVELHLDVDARAVDAPIAASSFAIGKGRAATSFEATGDELRRAAILAGPGGQAAFDMPEGKDESAWLGYTSFDPRAVAAEIAAFRTLLNEYFWRGLEPHPATAFFVTDARPRGRFRVARQANGVIVALSGNELYDAPIRLAVAHELVHAWIGQRIWVGSAEPGREAESFWFHEGVARWVAREQLVRAGLLSPEDLASEVNRLLAIVTTSAHASRSSNDLAGDAARTPAIVSLLVARGALFATLADARVREATKGESSFDDVVRAIAKRALDTRGPLPADAVHVELSRLAGEARARADFDDVVTSGRRTRLPDDALGGCFEARDATYEVRDEGVDVPASRAAGLVVGLDPRGLAARAGLREGDRVVSIDVAAGVGQKTRIAVEREGAKVTVAYDPVSGTRRGQSFRRRAGLSDTACRKLLLRH